MLLDGPLQGKTIRREFLESGDPAPRLEIPADGKRYLYSRAGGVEYAGDDSGRPTAVEYRFLQTLVD